MRIPSLATMLVLLTALTPYALTLSEPHLIKPSYTGSPSNISVGPDGLVGIIFYDRQVAGLYSEERGVYLEVKLPAKPSEILMSSGKAFLITPSPPKLLSLDINTKEITVRELEDTPGDLELDGDMLFVSLPRMGMLKAYDVMTLDEVDTWRAPVADGLNVVTASGRYVWVLDESLRAVLVFSGGETRRVDVDGTVVAVDSEGDRFWAATSDRRIITFRGWDGPVQSFQLPSGTVVDSQIVAAGGKLFYVSPNRRTVGVIEEGEVAEKPLIEYVPRSPSMGPGKRLWFVESVSSGLGWVADSKPPTISQLSAGTLVDGSVEISAKVVDPDGDLDPSGVMAQILVYTGVYVSLNETVGMVHGSDGIFSVRYVPPVGATRLDVSVVAFDSVGNRAVVSVGSMDLTATRTTMITTNPPTSPVPEPTPTSILPLALELLLVLPLLVGVAYLGVRKFGRRSKSRKKS